MSLNAAGIYLRLLREAAGMSRRRLALQLDTDISQIERLEKGQIRMSGARLATVAAAVKGQASDLQALLTLPDDAGDAEANQRAERLLHTKAIAATSTTLHHSLAQALRDYWTMLRTTRSVSQKALATYLQRSLRSIQGYETSTTEELPTSVYLRAVFWLGGTGEDLGILTQATARDAARTDQPSIANEPTVSETFNDLLVRASELPPTQQVELIKRLLDAVQHHLEVPERTTTPSSEVQE